MEFLKRPKILLAAMLLAMGSAWAQPMYGGWAFSREIHFNTTSSGANVTGNVTDFPIHVRLDASNFIFSQAESDGRDIRFETSSYTGSLDYQIERWDATAKVADIWVRVPQIYGNSSMGFFRMFWGKAGAASESNGANVFRTSSGFQGAWHLSEEGNTNTGGYADATANGNDGTGIGLDGSSDAAGASGRGQAILAASNQGIGFGSNSTLSPTGSMSVDVWFKADALSPNAVILGKPYGSDAYPYHEYMLGINATGTKATFIISVSGTDHAVDGATTLATGVWYHIAGTFDGATMRLYLNGVLDGTTSASGSFSDFGGALTLGKYAHNNSGNFNGLVDEPRFANVARSSDWMKLVYANLKPGPNLVAYGPKVWDGEGADANWYTAANWSDDQVPGPGEAVMFDGINDDPCTLNGPVRVRSITFSSGYTGAFGFGVNALTVDGDADFRTGGTITPSTGSLVFKGDETQTLIPPASETLPRILHDGQGTLTLSTNTLTCKGFHQVAGSLDFNSLNVVVNSLGHFLIHNGNGSSLMNMGGRTLTVAGNAQFFGQPGTHLNANPASTWTVNATGRLETWYANLGKCDATPSAASGYAAFSNDMGGNTDWSFAAAGYTWNPPTVPGDGNFNRSYNWSSDPGGGGVRPPTAKDDDFTADALGGNWSFLDLDNTAASGSYSLTARPDQLSLKGSGADVSSSYNQFVAVERADILGDFDVTVRVMLTTQHEVASKAGIMAANDFTNLAAGGYAALSLSPDGTVLWQRDLDGTGTIDASTPVAAGPGAVYLRMSKVSGLFRAWYKSGLLEPWNLIGSQSTIASASANSRIALFSTAGHANYPAESVFDDFESGTVLQSGLDLRFSGTGATADGNSALNVNAAAHLIDFTGYTGAFSLGANTLTLDGDLKLVAGMGFSGASGTVILNAASGTQNLFPAGKTFGSVQKAGAGALLLNGGGLTAGSLSIIAGTWDCGGLTDMSALGALTVSSGANLDFKDHDISVTGDINLMSAGTVAYATGALYLAGTTGMQILTPKSSGTLPPIIKNGAGTVQLSANAVQTAGYTQTAGTLDFNTRNLTVNGDCSIQGGTAAFSGLAGRTITVAGNMTLTGNSVSDRLNLNPGSAWTLAVTGTIAATKATVANGNASVATGICANCVAGAGGNTNWDIFIAWDGGGADENWNTAGNWGLDAVPTSADKVVFDATSAKNVILNVVGQVSGLKMTSGYTGTFNFGTQSLNINAGNADFRTGGTILPGSGLVYFLGTGAQTLIPPSGQPLPNLQRTNGGTVTITTNPYVGNDVLLPSGTIHLGSGLSHSINGFGSNGVPGGTLDFGTSNLATKATVDISQITVVAANANVLSFASPSTQQYFLPNAAATGLHLVQAGNATTTVSGTNFTTPHLAIQAGTFQLGTGRSHSAGVVATSGGTLEFQSSTLAITGASADFSGLAGVSAGTGTLALNGSSAMAFKPKANGTFPSIQKNGAGTVTLQSNALIAGSFNMAAGTLALGSGFTHKVASFGNAGGTLDFGTSTLEITSGDANFAGLGLANAATGGISFSAASGTQILTPVASGSLPPLTHAAAGTLRLATNTLSCVSFANSAGAIDFNGLDIATTGAFSVTGGTAATFIGLAGRTITVGGIATLNGATSTNRLNANPGAAWTLAVTGALSASLASLDWNSASGSPGTCDNCANLGNNANWGFSTAWDGGGSDANWSTAANWGGDFAPTSLDAVTFSAGSANSTLDAAYPIKSITFTSGYTGTFSFGSNTLTLNAGNADFRSGGAIFAGSGAIEFTGSGSQLFYPKAGEVLPAIHRNGNGGTTTITGGNLSAGNLTIAAGTVHLGSGLAHSVGSVSGSGSLDFGTSNLNAAGNVDFTGLAVTAASANVLAFTGGSAQNYTPASVTGLLLSQNGAGGTTLAGDVTTPSLGIASGTLNLGLGRTHTATAIAISGGGLDFSSSTLNTPAATVDFSALSALAPGSGNLRFTGAGNQSFSPKALGSHPGILANAGGTVTFTADVASGSSLIVQGGTLSLGNGRSHAFGAVVPTGGTLDFGTSDLRVLSGNADFSALSALTWSANSNLVFEAASGTQILTPKAAATLPGVTHPGASTLRLGGNITANAFVQGAGVLDLNGYNLTTTLDLIISGPGATLTGLGGRTLTAGGNATFTGQAGNPMALNPAGGWTLAAGNPPSVSYAALANCSASPTPGTASNTADGGGNSNWSFAVTWSGGGADNNWHTAGNWGSGAVPNTNTSVFFDATSAKDLYLDGDAAVKSIALGSGYTGLFDFGSRNLAVAGTADFRSGGGFAFGLSASLEFNGTAAQAFHPKSGAGMPNIRQNGPGGTSVTGGNLNGGNLSVEAGAFSLGTGLSHTIKDLSGFGTLHFNSSTLNVTGNADFTDFAAVDAGTGELAFTGSTAQVFLPGAIGTFPALRQNGSGGTTVSNSAFTTPALRIDNGVFKLGTSGVSHTVTGTFAATGGGLDFGTCTLKSAANVDLNPLATLTAGSGALELTGAAGQTVAGKTGGTHPRLIRNGSGAATLVSRGWDGGSLSISNGTLHLGTGLTHVFASVASPGAGVLEFGSSSVDVPGEADFGGLLSVDGGTGILTFTAASGSQGFTPKAGSTFPAVRHTGAGTLVLATYDLQCASFLQTAGTLDFNGRNVTVAGGGSFIVAGNSGSLVGLGGRALTVGGSASFRGLPSSRLAMNPGASWTLAVAGALTASNVELRNCQATVSPGTADSSANLGGNVNWTFIDTVPPANVSGFSAAALDGHAVRLAWTAPADADADSISLRYRTDGAYPAHPADGTLWRKVPNSRTADTATGMPDKTIFHFAAFARDSAGNWAAAATGARDTARTPDVTPPANVAGMAATAISGSSVALAWTGTMSADADSVMIRYRIGTGPPADRNDGILWRSVPVALATDTLTGLSANTIYTVGMFVRDSSGNFSPGTASSRDSALWQNPVTGAVAFLDAAGKTANPTPKLSLAGTGADSLRFSLLADTASAAWKPLHSTDSLAAAAGADGQRIVAAQFKNVFGTRSPWYRDTTLLDRTMAAPSLDPSGAYSYLTWPNTVTGKAVDAIAGTDTVFVTRQRESDNAWFNGSAWGNAADTARLRADSSFGVPLAGSALASGYYNLTAWAKDKLGNVSLPATARIRYDANRAPQVAADSVRDSVAQNTPIAWTLDLGDLDLGDTVTTLSASLPGWLAKSEASDGARGGFTSHRIYTITGKPGQAQVGVHSLSLQAKDVGGKTFTWSRSVTVVDVNDAPAFADGQENLAIKEDSIFRFVAAFADPDPQDKPVLSLISGPSWATLADSTLTLKPGSRDVGPAAVRLLLSDGRLSDTLDLKIAVANVNDAPVAFPAGVWPSGLRWSEDVVDTFSVVVVDMDRNDAVALATTLPPFLTYQVAMDSTGFNRTFRFTAKPGQQHAGSYDLKLRFQDNAGASGDLPLKAAVHAVNDAPTAAILGIETSGGAARAGLDAQDQDGSLAQTRFHYRLIAANGDTVRSGICAAPPLLLHPLADGGYKLAVAAEDEGGLKQGAFVTAPFAISGATALAIDSVRWHMLAYPGRALAAAALGDGASAATWDEAAADGSPLGRYATGKAADSLVRGKGYWVRTARRASLSAPAPELLDKPFALKLARGRQGWNQIGNPYPYFLDLSATGLVFWEWDSDRRDLVNARGLLKPWGAYWVQVAKDTLLTLRPEPWFPAGEGKAQGAALAKSAWKHAREWTLQLSLAAGPYRDASNFLGIKPVTPASGGAPAPGPLADAPKYGEFVALHFESPGAAQALASDIRPALDADEEWWDFSVENSGTGLSQASLDLPGLEALEAAGLHAFVVRQGEARELAAGEPAALAMEGAATHYALVITPHADFASRMKGSFALAQNFPNPVRGATTFRFFLPQAWGADGKRLATGHKLRLDVYDYSGRRVARVAEGTFMPGSHSLLWQARGAGGANLAAGNYVYRLETPGFVKSLKLLVK